MLLSLALVSLSVFAGPLKVLPVDAGSAELAAMAARADGARAILIGEQHYGAGVHELVSDYLDALLARGDIHLVVLETAYSATAHLDAYVTTSDEALAERLMEDLIRTGMFEEEGAQLERIRAHNLLHPGRMVHVGGSDIEHDTSDANRLVLGPFYEAVRRKDEQARSFSGWRAYVEYLEDELLPRARTEEVQLPNPLSYELVSQVLENLRDSWHAYDSRMGFMKRRQEAIRRNLLQPDHLGRFWLPSGRVLVYGGGWHTATGPRCDWTAEGCFLEREFAPTRGKTQSIMVAYLRTDLTRWQGKDMEACIEKWSRGTRYWRTLGRMRSQAEDEGLDPDHAFEVVDIPRRAGGLIAQLEDYGETPVHFVAGPGWALRLAKFGHDESVVFSRTPLAVPYCLDLEEEP